MSDEILYLQATDEVDGEERDPALWAKVMALVEGDQRKAKYKYIKLRVEQITKVKIKDKPIHTKKTGNEFDDKYISVEEFSIIKSIPVKKVVEMIRGGVYVGQLKSNGWFVSREDVGNEKQQSRFKPNNNSTKKISDKEYITIEEFSEYKGITRDKIVEMIKDGFYQGRIVDGKWYVAYSELENNHASTQYSSDSFLSKLISGDYSLPKAYWLFGVLGDVFFNILVTIALASGATAVHFLVMIASVIYALIVSVGIWRSSDKYQGLKVWAILAKISVVIRILAVLVGLALLGTNVSV